MKISFLPRQAFCFHQLVPVTHTPHIVSPLSSYFYPAIHLDHPGHLFPEFRTGQVAQCIRKKYTRLPEEVGSLTAKLKTGGKWEMG